MSGAERLAELLERGVVVMDGAMGTMLQSYGLEPGECPERMNLEASDIVARVHREYVAAGARMIETNTFGATPVRLSRYGLADQAAEINRRAVQIAKEAAGQRSLVLGAIGPLGELVEPYGEISETAARSSFALQAEAFAAMGADGIIVETMGDLSEALLALEAGVAVGLPVIAQMTYDQSGRTFMGVDPRRAASESTAAGASVVGVNCSAGPGDILPIVADLRSSTGLPISALPNAGMPQVVAGTTHWPLTPADFGAWGVRLVEVGARLIGGCCGTTHEHVAALVSALQGAGVSLA